MTKFEFDSYHLLLSDDPCSIFEYYEEAKLCGLDYHDCIFRENTPEDSYLAGLCNMIPYSKDKQFVFINTLKCTDDLSTILLINHELMHHSLYLHTYNLHREEEIISWAEQETRKVYEIIKNELQANNSSEEDKSSEETN
jgi:hypothetical protein